MTTETLPTQVFVGSKPAERRFNEIKPFPEPFWKPLGGMWTSTLRDGTCGWIEWATGERFDLKGTPWLIDPLPSKVYTLDCFEALEALFGEYGMRLYPGQESLGRKQLWAYGTILWPRFAQDWDALHLTESGLWGGSPEGIPLRLASMFIYGWDCESTCWAKWRFDESTVRPLPGEAPAT